MSQDRFMMMEGTERQHRDKREAKAVPMISVAQVTAIVRNARCNSNEMEKISNTEK